MALQLPCDVTRTVANQGWSESCKEELLACLAGEQRAGALGAHKRGRRWSCSERGQEHLYSQLGVIRDALLLDAQAIYEGDPAAASVDEVILAYPGFLAIATYRIAHELHSRAALFSRLLAEVAHRATGIDIHPGARIGASFAIDHGTGIVIGESAVSAHGSSFTRASRSAPRGSASAWREPSATRRSATTSSSTPTRRSSGAETAVGRGSRIGGNVWLTRSVGPYPIVTPTAHLDRRGTDAPVDDLIEFNI